MSTTGNYPKPAPPFILGIDENLEAALKNNRSFEFEGQSFRYKCYRSFDDLAVIRVNNGAQELGIEFKFHEFGSERFYKMIASRVKNETVDKPNWYEPSEHEHKILRHICSLLRMYTKDREELIRCYTMIIYKGQADEMDIYRFLEYGIPILDALATFLGLSKKEVMKKADNEKITYPAFRSSLELMTSDGGVFDLVDYKEPENQRGLKEILFNLFGIKE